MASNSTLLAFLCLVGLMVGASLAQLNPSFYAKSCPNLAKIVNGVVANALRTDARAGAKLIRFHFHDCFVDGCDASVLLENAPGIDSELDAPGNQGIQGLNIIDDIKSAVEKACPRTVSCADILTIASRESVVLAGGPSWIVPLGRRDSRTANKEGATNNLASPFEDLDGLKAKFSVFGLDSTDLVALSGAHTFGRSRCAFFSHRFANFNGTNRPDPTLDPAYREQLRRVCSSSETRANFDPTTPDKFDKNYYTNLQGLRGLLQSDQELFSTRGADTVAIVNRFAKNQDEFFKNFGRSMIKMGNISPLTGKKGEIRLNCRRVNSPPRADEGHDVM
ncbi:peroxidase 2-like [Cucurbita pepo subsp. pepo]|uniref:peroxidase 2-like n=1 Tax=Cucurbita pepo subsp. pepo TaxID=3664 RepID=UPI000C9D5880|nr:peroxidase 2-like [Cucurbita pepo subsp. pepo]